MQDTDEIVVGLAGHVYAAPLGSAGPTNVSAAWNADWIDLGYTTEEGLTITSAKTLNEIRGWPSPNVLRRWVAQRDLTVALTLIQFSAENLIRALGGGNVDEVSAGLYRYAPPVDEDLGEFMLGVEWQDGADIYRLVVFECLPSENVDIPVNRTDAVQLPLTVMASVPGGEGELYEILTNAASFAPTAS